MKMSKWFAPILLVVLLAGSVLAPIPSSQATVNEVTAVNRYTGNGSTTVFSYTFKIFAKTDIEVIVDDTVKTVDTHYTVSGLGASGGGSVTFLTAPLNAAKVTLLRKQPASQLSVYTPSEPFPAARLEKDLDKATQQIQQIKEQLLRGVFFNKKTTFTGGTLDDLSAGKYARVNAGATGLEWVDLTVSGAYANPITTKGDLLCGGAAGVASRLGVGSDLQWLTADSTQACGLRWTSGPLGVGFGGTGLTSGTSGGVLYFSAANTMASSGAFTNKGVLLGGGAGAAPTSTAAGTAGQSLHVDAAAGTPAFHTTGPTGTFRGLHLRSHPDNDVANSKIMLVHADEIVVSDGTRVNPADGLVLNTASTGAAGGMQAAAVNSTWNKVYYIRKSTDGTENLWGLRAKNYLQDVSQTSVATAQVFRDNAARTKLAQGFQVVTAGKVDFVEAVSVDRVSSPVGNYWFTLETDSSGSPSGTLVCSTGTSDKYDAARVAASAPPVIRLPFRTPCTLSTSTQYHLVLNGDFTISGANHIRWNGCAATCYANGSAKQFDGATWSAASAVADFGFRIYITQNDTAVAPPGGYDQFDHIGWFYIDGSGNIKKFMSVDRKIWTAKGPSWKALASVSTLALQDFSAFIPPGSTLVGFSYGNVAGNQASMGHISATDTANSTDIENMSMLSMLAGNVTYPSSGFNGPMLLEYQAAYFVAGGAVSAWIDSIQW